MRGVSKREKKGEKMIGGSSVNVKGKRYTLREGLKVLLDRFNRWTLKKNEKDKKSL